MAANVAAHTVKLSSEPCADRFSPLVTYLGEYPANCTTGHSRICSTETSVRPPVAGPLWPALFSWAAPMLAGSSVTHTVSNEIRATMAVLLCNALVSMGEHQWLGKETSALGSTQSAEE